jgi:hypothetical protein
MSEYWGKGIIEARIKLKDGHIDEGISLLMELAKSKNHECAKESKKLLVKTLAQIENKKILAKSYLEDLYKEERNINNSAHLMKLSAAIGDLSSVNKYYNESLNLLESQGEINGIFLDYIYFESLVTVKADFSDTFGVILKLVDHFRKIKILDHHFLITRRLPSFYGFLKTVELFYINNNKPIELIKFLQDQLSWVDESGKEVISEILLKYP